MSKFKVLLKHPDGTEEMEEEVFNTEAEAEAHGCYMIGCIRRGAEILFMSNPGDNPMDGFEDSDFEIIEIED